MFRVNTKGGACKICQNALDLFFSDGLASDFHPRICLQVIRKELHRADTITTYLLKQAKGIGAPGAGALGHYTSDVRIIRQEIVEDRRDKLATICSLA